MSEITPALCLYVFTFVFFIVSVRYLVLAGLTYTVFWKLLKERLHHRRIQQKFPGASKLWAEFKWSFATFVIFALMGVGMHVLRNAGYTQNYANISDYGWGYWFLSIALMAVLHDAYFYWTHRFMHLKSVFKYVHRVHHESSNPSPWAAFSFHPIEAAIEFGIVVVIALTIPYHISAMIVFFTYMTLMNISATWATKFSRAALREASGRGGTTPRRTTTCIILNRTATTVCTSTGGTTSWAPTIATTTRRSMKSRRGRDRCEETPA